MQKIVLFTISILAFGHAYAQEFVTDRPDQTESSSTIQKGAIQIETGYLISTHDMDKNVRARNFSFPTNLFRIGLSKNMELRIVNSFEVNHTLTPEKPISKKSGFSNLEIGFKARFLNESENTPEIAFLSHYVIPTASNTLENIHGFINKIAISKTLSEQHSIGLNLGYDYFYEDQGNLTYSLAWGIGLSEKFSIYLEAYGDLENLDSLVASADAGITYLIKENMQLDYSFGTGINHKMNYQSIGFSIRIPK